MYTIRPVHARFFDLLISASSYHMYPFPRRRDGGCLRRDLTTTLTDDPLLRDDLQTGAKTFGKKKTVKPSRKISQKLNGIHNITYCIY